MKRLLVLVFLLLAAALARVSFYTVDAAEYAYVTLLGKHVATYDGQVDAGLYQGWPWPLQMVQRLDRRLQQFDIPAKEELTRDTDGATVDKRLLIQAYVCWRIRDAQAVDRFVRRIGSADRARDLLGTLVNSELGARIGQMKMDDFVSTQAAERDGRTRTEASLDGLRYAVLAALRKPIDDEYGIELLDVRLRRFNHPPNVRDSIYERIRSERGKKAMDYQSEGELLARNLESEAEEKSRDLLSKARAEEERIKGRADAEAMHVRNQAYRQDPEFYAFLKKIERLQTILGDSKTMLLLSTHRPLFESLFQPPRPAEPGRAPAPAPEARKEGE